MKYPHFSYVVARAFVIAIVYYIIVASVKSRRNTLYSGLMIKEISIKNQRKTIDRSMNLCSKTIIFLLFLESFKTILMKAQLMKTVKSHFAFPDPDVAKLKYKNMR